MKRHFFYILLILFISCSSYDVIPPENSNLKDISALLLIDNYPKAVTVKYSETEGSAQYYKKNDEERLLDAYNEIDLKLFLKSAFKRVEFTNIKPVIDGESYRYFPKVTQKDPENKYLVYYNLNDGLYKSKIINENNTKSKPTEEITDGDSEKEQQNNENNNEENIDPLSKLLGPSEKEKKLEEEKSKIEEEKEKQRIEIEKVDYKIKTPYVLVIHVIEWGHNAHNPKCEIEYTATLYRTKDSKPVWMIYRTAKKVSFGFNQFAPSNAKLFIAKTAVELAEQINNEFNKATKHN